MYAGLKRLADLCLGAAGMGVLGALLPLVALANRLTSPGPIFYRQVRAGKGGRLYTVIKLRTMRPGAESETGAVWAAEDDARVTRLGRWLRKTRLDELPQCINVLRGEMSVIGPRPERPEFVDDLAAQIPFYRVRHAVKPGITGWAQMQYRYGNTVGDAQVKLEYDLYYVKHAGPYLDLCVLLRTLPVMLRMEG
jgi:lipopolysaccharide/colanic/teichoic acid biosynthesis glycosyltransferase